MEAYTPITRSLLHFIARASAVINGIVPDIVLRHAGLVMTQAASIASVLQIGELICPFAVITKGENRQSIEFEARSQDDAVSEGWASLEKYKENFDLWAFAREGLVNGPDGKEDVLLVAAWTHGMQEPIVFLQQFLPIGKGGFALVGPIVAQDQPTTALDRIADLFMDGVREHPKGHLWTSWCRA
jgi:hypothetical protein